jgi:hypothetical protein
LGGGQGRGFLGIVQCAPNYFKHGIGVGKHIMIPEPNYAIAFGFKPCIAIGIVFLVVFVVVLTAIDLNQQALLQAGEVNDMRTYRNLAAKLVTAKLLVLQLCPQSDFGFGHV